MNSPAYDLAQFLNNRVGVWAQTLHVGSEPETPDEVTTLYDTGGSEPDTDELDVFRPTIQVRTRAKSYQAAYAKQDEIRALLASSTPIMAGSSRFSLVTLQSDIISLGKDENDRYILTANYRCIRSAL